jgi:ribosomal protein L37E
VTHNHIITTSHCMGDVHDNLCSECGYIFEGDTEMTEDQEPTDAFRRPEHDPDTRCARATRESVSDDKYRCSVCKNVMSTSEHTFVAEPSAREPAKESVSFTASPRHFAKNEDEQDYVQDFKAKATIVIQARTLNAAMDLVSALHVALDPESEPEESEAAREAVMRCLSGCQLHSAQTQRVKS